MERIRFFDHERNEWMSKPNIGLSAQQESELTALKKKHRAIEKEFEKKLLNLNVLKEINQMFNKK